MCPQPMRAFPPPSPGEDLGSRSPGSFVASQTDLRELLSNSGTPCNGGIAGMKDGHVSAGGPFSEMSTSAGATPNPDDRSSPRPWPPTPDSQRAVQSPNGRLSNLGGGALGRRRGGGGAGLSHSAKALSPNPAAPGGCGGTISEGSGSGPPRQAGKVFVGGVPQDMSQDDLYQIFSEWGGVKKAWLQSYRTAGRINQSPPHNHRGFGFVIFYDTSSLDNFLGKSNSRFLPLRDGRRLEVKRAVPSSDLPCKPVPGAAPVGPEFRSSYNRNRGSSGAQDAGRPAAPAAPVAVAAAAAPLPAQYLPPQPLPSPGPWPGGAVPGGQAAWSGMWPTYMAQQALPAPGQGQGMLQQPQPQHNMMMAQMQYNPHAYAAFQQPVPHGAMPLAQAPLPNPHGQQLQHHPHSQMPLSQPHQQQHGQQVPSYFVMPGSMPLIGAQAGPAAQQAHPSGFSPAPWTV